MYTTQVQTTNTVSGKKPLKERFILLWQKIIKNDIWSDLVESVDPAKIILVGLALLVTYAYKYELNELYKEFVVCTVLERFTGDVAYDVLAAVIWIAVIFYCARKVLHFHKFHRLTTVTVILICSIYFFFRLHYTEVYYFYGFSEYPKLAYFDILFFPFITFSFLFLFNGILLLKSYFKEDDFSKGFLTDSPLGTSGSIAKDLFGWQPKAKQLVDRIDESNAPHSFAIGISSEWGSGKTSFFSLVNNELDQKNASKYIRVHFNPWLSNDTNKIIEDFFSVLQEAARKYDSKLSSDLVSYSNKLQTLSPSTLTNLIHVGIETFYSESDLSTKYDDINNLIKRLGKKIIIFIDDLDRLNKKEVVEILRIIRNTSNFYNTFFILAYDRSYINSAVKEINDYSPDKYLDKIVQFELSLPGFNPALLNDIFLTKLHIALEPETYNANNYDKEYFIDLPVNTTLYSQNKPKRGLWDFSYELEIHRYLKNIRDINRFINQFLFDFIPLKEQVSRKDFLLLSLIKFNYPTVWSLLADNDLKYSLLKERSGKFLLREKPKVEKLINNLLDLLPKPKYSNALDAYLNFIQEEEKKDESGDFTYDSIEEDNRLEKLRSTESVWALLTRLFDDEEDISQRSIVYESNHYLYFFKDASTSSEYSLSEFYSEVNEEEVSLQHFVANFIHKAQNTPVSKVVILLELISNTFSSTLSFNKVLFAYSRLIYNTEWSEQKVLDLIYKINKAGGKTLTLEQKQAAFRNLVSSYQGTIEERRFIAYVNYLIIYYQLRSELNQEDAKFEFIIEKEEIQKLNYKILRKYKYKRVSSAFTKKGLFDLFRYNLDSLDPNTRGNIINRKAIASIRHTILRNVFDYFNFLIRPKYNPNQEQVYRFEPYTFTIFNNYKGNEGVLGFEQFLSDQCASMSRAIHYQRIITLYAAMYTLNQNSTGEENHFINDEDATVYIDNYNEWFDAPLDMPINQSVINRVELYKEVVNRICPSILNGSNSFTWESDIIEDTELNNAVANIRYRHNR